MEKRTLLPQLDTDRAHHLYNEMGLSFWPVIGTANHVAMQALFDTYDVLEESGLLRRQVKFYMNRAVKGYDSYLTASRRALGDRFPLWSDLSRIAAAKLATQVGALYEEILRFLNQHHIEEPELRATICHTDALINISCAIFDTFLHHFQRQTLINISSQFRPGRMTAVQHAFQQVAQAYLRIKDGDDIDINGDTQAMKAMADILGQYEKMDFIDEASQEAVRLNPSMLKYMSKEDQQRFRQ